MNHKLSGLRSRMDGIIAKRKLDITYSCTYDDLTGKYRFRCTQCKREVPKEWHDHFASGMEYSNRWLISCFVIYKPGILKSGKLKLIEIGNNE